MADAETAETCRDIEQMRADELAPIVGSALRNPAARVVKGWTATQFKTSSRGSGTLGFILVTGTAAVGGHIEDWSLVVKVVDTRLEEGFVSSAREVAVFRSGFLQRLKGSLKGIPCHGITERANGRVLLWLQDMRGATLPPWSTENFVSAARAVGHFNGSWPESAAPTEDWLDRTLATSRPRIGLQPEFAARVESKRGHEVLRRVGAGIGEHRLYSVAAEFAGIVKASHRLPRVVTHNDCHPRNLYISKGSDNAVATYAADWSSIGLGPVGLDGGTLIAGGMTRSEREAIQAADVESAVFSSYVRGLRDAGYEFDRDHVRLGFLSNLVIWVFGYAVIASDIPDRGPWAVGWAEQFEADGNELVEQLALRLKLFMPLFDEAVALARDR